MGFRDFIFGRKKTQRQADAPRGGGSSVPADNDRKHDSPKYGNHTKTEYGTIKRDIDNALARDAPVSRLKDSALKGQYRYYHALTERNPKQEARFKELEAEWSRRGNKPAPSPEWLKNYQNVKPKANIQWKDAQGNARRGF